MHEQAHYWQRCPPRRAKISETCHFQLFHTPPQEHEILLRSSSSPLRGVRGNSPFSQEKKNTSFLLQPLPTSTGVEVFVFRSSSSSHPENESPALFVTVISKMTFDNRATVKNLTLTFWPKNFFEVNIHVEKPGKKLGTKSQC